MSLTIKEIKRNMKRGDIPRIKLTVLKTHMGLIMGPKPFQVLSEGVVIAEICEPNTKWYCCENCGENTKNYIQFQQESRWESLVLCDRCSANLLK